MVIFRYNDLVSTKSVHLATLGKCFGHQLQHPSDDTEVVPGAALPMVRDRGDDGDIVPGPALANQEAEEESDVAEESDVEEEEEQLSGESVEDEDHLGDDERDHSGASRSFSPEERSGGDESTDVEEQNQDADVEDNDLAGEDEPYLDQSRRPRKGDVVSFRQGGDFGHWIEARVTSAQTGTQFYYNVKVLETGEAMGVWLRPAQVTVTGHQEAWQLGRRQDFMRSPSRPPSRRASLEYVPREEETPFQGMERSISSTYEL